MRSFAVLVMASVLGGCMLDIWGGGYAVKQPNDTSMGFALGASLSFYIDPGKTRTRIGVGAGVDKVWEGGPTTSIKRNGAQFRADFAFDGRPPTSEYDTRKPRRATVILTAGSNSTFVNNMEMKQAESTMWMLFAGYTKELVQNPGVIWRDTISYSIGPAFGQWRGDLTGDITMVGAQGHLTFAFSPLVVLSILGSSGSAVREVANKTAPTTYSTPDSSTSSPSNGTCPGGYYKDQCDVGGKNCKSVWTCP